MVMKRKKEEQRNTINYGRIQHQVTDPETITGAIVATNTIVNRTIIMLEMVWSDPQDFQLVRLKFSISRCIKQNDLVRVQIFCIHYIWLIQL